MQKGFSIAIDGPVAAGKGTVAVALAKRLHGFYFYTGAMYRCLALSAMRNNISVSDSGLLLEHLKTLPIRLEAEQVFLGDENVTELIKDRTVAEQTSILSAYAPIREEMVRRQQQIVSEKMEQGLPVVVEGRDIGTKVLPHAILKVYITADIETRAKRRFEQLHQKGETTVAEVLADTKVRDERDHTRDADPLVRNPKEYGYVVIDNTALSEEETVSAILHELEIKQKHV